MVAISRTDRFWKPWQVTRWGPQGREVIGYFWTKRGAMRRAAAVATHSAEVG
jgi:hypothetical protein